jgi:hypothetical protein
MAIATRPSGKLIQLDNCYIRISNRFIRMKILPDITDSKSATYSDEPVMGRSTPLKTYSHSDNRTISWTAHFVVEDSFDLKRGGGLLDNLRAIESLVYPQDKKIQPFTPPPILKIKCGNLLSDGGELCVVLRSYSVKFPTDVPWADEKNGYTPYQFSVDLSFDVVYDSKDLPGQERILDLGR